MGQEGIMSYFLIALFIIVFTGLLFFIFWRLDKKGGEKRTTGLLKLMAMFKSDLWPNNYFRR